MTDIKFDYKKYGKPGSRIQNSICTREYCPICGSPLRISGTVKKKDLIDFCVDCNPKHAGVSSPRCKNDNEDEYSSSWRIATNGKD